MGRRVEDVMFWKLMSLAKKLMLKLLKLRLYLQKKNRPTFDIFNNSYFKKTKKYNYEIKVGENFKKPNIIKIIT